MAVMDATVTILVDNNKAEDGLCTEHGLSFWIEILGRRILFDTGQGPSLEPNAQALGVDLSKTDILVLSHGHYDHTGGIASVIRSAPDLHVYCHPGVVQARYAIRDGKAKSIGIPQAAKEALEGVPSDHLHWVEKPTMLTDVVGLTGPVPRLTDYEDTGGPFFLDPEGERPDLIEDDLALWIRTKTGTVVCLGCAHAGPVNTLDHIVGLTGDPHLRAVIGGFHLMDAGRERVDQTILAMRRLAPDSLLPCHCTGRSPTTLLQDPLGDQVTPGKSGMVFRF
ncbi:MAG: MBL fold metallo-hydrolase [Actinobacteria bacterium]|nr:MBL fold metallo-hydrolase [Actinomycetota bacterium]